MCTCVTNASVVDKFAMSTIHLWSCVRGRQSHGNYANVQFLSDEKIETDACWHCIKFSVEMRSSISFNRMKKCFPVCTNTSSSRKSLRILLFPLAVLSRVVLPSPKLALDIGVGTLSVRPQTHLPSLCICLGTPLRAQF